MSESRETYKSRRWYDKDPVLSKAMTTLSATDDKVQIQIALNLIKIVIEHKIEEEDVTSVNDILSSVSDANSAHEGKTERWYDLNETVRAAILMLEQTPEDLQKKIALDMAELITRVIKSQEN
ncbi:MAG: hypothetical protein AB7V50_08250 [Vampirovibrionia bacterium]